MEPHSASDGEFENNDGIQPPGEWFIVTEEGRQYLRRFSVKGRTISFRIGERENFVLWLESAIVDIHNYITERVPGSNFIGVSVRSEPFAQGPDGLSFRPIENFTIADLWDLTSSICQSNAILDFDDTLILQAYYVAMPVGAGGIPEKPALTVSSLRKRSLVTIQNDDNLCLPRALVVARVHLTLKTQGCAATHKEWQIIRESRRKLQKERAEKLVNDADVFLPYDGCGFRELLAFQNFLSRRESL